MEAAATARDLQYLRHAIALAAASKARGKHPFAALIVDDRDAVLAEASNAFGWPDGDATGHAELIAVREASRRFREGVDDAPSPVPCAPGRCTGLASGASSTPSRK